MNIRTLISTIACFFALLFVSKDSIAGEGPNAVPLFAESDPLKFTLVFDTRALKKDSDPEPEYAEGQLILHEGEADQEFLIKVRPRGNSRRFFDFCTFPPIKLNFKKKDVNGTIFDGQDKLKLVAYCKDIEVNESYNLKEYLVYKFYNILTSNSYKVRLAHITYKDVNNKGKDVQRYGFLIEDNDQMAERLGGMTTEALMSNHDRCQRQALDLFTMFQYMIGNTDWWIAKPKQHNVNVIQMPDGVMIPVPYDFDYCGIVDANYAVPPEELELTNVKQRLFRGYCRLPGTYERTAEIFNEHRDEIFDLIANFEPLNDRYKKVMTKYIEDFYKIINNEKLMVRHIYDACEINHVHLHTGK